jgi:FMN phosphatase YigB (HAD superfamily)
MFDWMLTLADYPDEHEHLRQAHRLIDRPATDDEIGARRGSPQAAALPDVQAAAAEEDCSSGLHRAATMLHCRRAGIDELLAEAMYGLLGHPSFHPIYGGVEDALRAIQAAGMRISVISDIHVDLRDHARPAGIEGFIEHWILSFEHGVQKPNPKIFRRNSGLLETSSTPCSGAVNRDH